MTKLEKIEKWANENGYDYDELWHGGKSDNIEVNLYKQYELKNVVLAWQCIEILLTDKIEIKHYTSPYKLFTKHEDIENQFIPLILVERDEQSLREYLEND